MPRGYISLTHSPGARDELARLDWMLEITCSAYGFIESVQSLEMSLRAMVAARESSGLVRAEVTMGVTWGSRWGWTASQSEKPPIQSRAVEITRVLLWNGIT